MTKKSVSGGWKAVVLILFFLSELVLTAGILSNLQSVCNILPEAVTTFLHRTLFFLIEIGAAIVLILDTMILGITKALRKFPSLMTVLAFVYNDLAVIATVFGLYMFGQPRSWFPYPLAFLIPAITFLLALICLIDDFIRDKGVIEDAPNVTKMAAQSTLREKEVPKATPAPQKATPVQEPVKEAEPAFFVTPAPKEEWAEVQTEPEVVPATESVEAPVHISKDNAAADAIAAVDDLFFAFSDSDYVEEDLAD